MNTLSKEEMRNARMKALGVIPRDSNIVEPADKKQAIAITSRSIDNEIFRKLSKVIYQFGGATNEDMLRWYNQGFNFCIDPYFGLKQSNGGPCGVLAVIQAEILKEILFMNTKQSKDSLPNKSENDLNKILAQAIINILQKASADTKILQLVVLSSNITTNKLPNDWTTSDFSIISFQSNEDAFLYILENQLIDKFQSKLGCILFLYSLVFTRGIDRIILDMDDKENTLIGQYGYCNQDLINLLLTGKATSNVIDGELPLGDSGLCLKGVYQQSSIGYLTHLEALRYCQVGSYYKVPKYPIWVIGSTSHFTVLFSLNTAVNHESIAEKMLTILQRSFKAIDIDECGFIPSSKLIEVLENICKNEEYNNKVLCLINNETNLARIRGYLQIDGEIILWSSFWQCFSSILSGKSIDDVISSSIAVPMLVDNEIHHQDNVINSSSSSSTNTYVTRLRSDSDMARELQALIDNELLPGDNFISNNTHNGDIGDISNNSSMRIRSDSELAREMQAQWDAEDCVQTISGTNDTTTMQYPTTSSSSSSSNMMIPGSSQMNVSEQQEVVVDHSIRSHIHRSDSIAEDTTEQFTMYHFNGLESIGRSSLLTCFKLFIRSSVDATGISIAFSNGDNIGPSYICPIEEVLRTRWQGCRINWMNKTPPSID